MNKSHIIFEGGSSHLEISRIDNDTIGPAVVLTASGLDPSDLDGELGRPALVLGKEELVALRAFLDDQLDEVRLDPEEDVRKGVFTLVEALIQVEKAAALRMADAAITELERNILAGRTTTLIEVATQLWSLLGPQFRERLRGKGIDLEPAAVPN